MNRPGFVPLVAALLACGAACAGAAAPGAAATDPSPASAGSPGAEAAPLVAALRRGGHVIVMRHARSPGTPPDAATARPGNAARERQLDLSGRADAQAMGAALRRLGIPVGEVLSSPTWRARETVELLGVPAPTLAAELGDGGTSMAGVGVAEGAWLRQRAYALPAAGNTLIVTHVPNLRAAFGTDAGDVADGESLVFGRDADGTVRMLGRIPVDRWTALSASDESSLATGSATAPPVDPALPPLVVSTWHDSDVYSSPGGLVVALINAGLAQSREAALLAMRSVDRERDATGDLLRSLACAAVTNPGNGCREIRVMGGGQGTGPPPFLQPGFREIVKGHPAREALSLNVIQLFDGRVYQSAARLTRSVADASGKVTDRPVMTVTFITTYSTRLDAAERARADGGTVPGPKPGSREARSVWWLAGEDPRLAREMRSARDALSEVLSAALADDASLRPLQRLADLRTLPKLADRLPPDRKECLNPWRRFRLVAERGERIWIALEINEPYLFVTLRCENEL